MTHPTEAVVAPPDASAANTLSSDLTAMRPKLLRHARVLVRDATIAEDLVQETLLAVFERRAQHQGASTLNTWATAILKNKVADWYRSPDRVRLTSIQTDDAGSTDDALDHLFNAQGEHAAPVQAWQQPETQMETRQLKNVLDQCVERLSGLQGTAFMMREWLGFETHEVAQRLDISAENCRTLLHRARLSLRGCLQVRWYGKVGA